MKERECDLSQAAEPVMKLFPIRVMGTETAQSWTLAKSCSSFRLTGFSCVFMRYFHTEGDLFSCAQKLELKRNSSLCREQAYTVQITEGCVDVCRLVD